MVTTQTAEPEICLCITSSRVHSRSSLTDAAAPNGQTLSPGAYSVSEAVPAGWVLTGLSCVSSLGKIGRASCRARVEISGVAASLKKKDANDTVTCTFTDTKRGQIVVDKVSKQ